MYTIVLIPYNIADNTIEQKILGTRVYMIRPPVRT